MVGIQLIHGLNKKTLRRPGGKGWDSKHETRCNAEDEKRNDEQPDPDPEKILPGEAELDQGDEEGDGADGDEVGDEEAELIHRLGEGQIDIDIDEAEKRDEDGHPGDGIGIDVLFKVLDFIELMVKIGDFLLVLGGVIGHVAVDHFILEGAVIGLYRSAVKAFKHDGSIAVFDVQIDRIAADVGQAEEHAGLMAGLINGRFQREALTETAVANDDAGDQIAGKTNDFLGGNKDGFAGGKLTGVHVDGIAAHEAAGMQIIGNCVNRFVHGVRRERIVIGDEDAGRDELADIGINEGHKGHFTFWDDGKQGTEEIFSIPIF